MENIVYSHFANRAERYNHSSNWVKDSLLIDEMFRLSECTPKSVVLDIATGTGLLAKRFFKNVDKIIGVDICNNMTDLSNWVDELHIQNAEKLDFPSNYFDAVICRQGLQFMDLNKVIPEIYRVLKFSGKVVLCHITAYSEQDKELSFLTQKLRNPARKNFFLPNDIPNYLKKYNFLNVESYNYRSEESINQWIDHGAISKEQMGEIRETYRKANISFLEIHKVHFSNGDIFDTMNIPIVKATK